MLLLLPPMVVLIWFMGMFSFRSFMKRAMMLSAILRFMPQLLPLGFIISKRERRASSLQMVSKHCVRSS